jgi:uncharacterized Zn-binding protein involved in type VI secretion
MERCIWWVLYTLWQRTDHAVVFGTIYTTTSHDHPHINNADPLDCPQPPLHTQITTMWPPYQPNGWTTTTDGEPTHQSNGRTTMTASEPPHQPNRRMTMTDSEPPHQPNGRTTTMDGDQLVNGRATTSRR